MSKNKIFLQKFPEKIFVSYFFDKETIIYYSLGGLFTYFLGLFAVFLRLSASFCAFPALSGI